ncbi:MAG: hypothetical protein AAF141_15245 [Pseudomonadota bacterium]
MTQKLDLQVETGANANPTAHAQGSNGPFARLVDFARYRQGPDDAHSHPLVAASRALGDTPRTRARTANLVSLLMTHASRARRRSQTRVDIRMCVMTPDGAPAVKLRLR